MNTRLTHRETRASRPGSREGTAHAEQIQQQPTKYADIVLFCHPRNVDNLVRSFEDEMQHAAGELPVRVIWSGFSSLLRQGVIILEWEGTVSPAFLRNLRIDHEIFDFVVPEWIRNDDPEPSADEPGGA